MSIEFTKTHETWEFHLGQRDGGMIAIMLNEELDPEFHTVYDLPIDITQEPMTYMGVYAYYIIQVDTDECLKLGIDLGDLRDAIEVWIEQIIRIAYAYNPLDSRPNQDHKTYTRQRHAVMELDNTL